MNHRLKSGLYILLCLALAISARRLPAQLKVIPAPAQLKTGAGT